jgi:photosystem II stability/assembly factor-like uncharacterized protein
MRKTVPALTLLLSLVSPIAATPLYSEPLHSETLHSETTAEEPGTDGARTFPCRSLGALLPRATPLLGGVIASNFSLLVGDRGLLVRGSSDGLSWVRIPSVTSVMLTSASVSDDDIALVAGHDQTILRSIDGGHSWSLVHQATGVDTPLFDIAFVSPKRAFAVGAYGTVLTSTDAGITWEPYVLSDGEDRHAYALAEGPEGLWIMVGEAGLMYRWSHNEPAWHEITNATRSSLFDAVFCPDESLLAVGLNGRIYRSSATLDSWTSVENTIGSSLFTVSSHPSGLLMSGAGGALVSAQTCDGPFQVSHTPERLAISAILRLDSGAALLLGESGVSCLAEGHR